MARGMKKAIKKKKKKVTAVRQNPGRGAATMAGFKKKKKK